MKKPFLLFLVLFSINLSFVNADGICIVDSENGIHLQLLTSDIHVSVNNQIATIKTTQSFLNNTGEDVMVKYAFPMTETASALELRWLNNNYWYTADFEPSPQDTTLPGGGSGGGASSFEVLLASYLGENPLYFNLEQVIPKDSTITFELTFVDLLFYEFDQVEYYHKNDYSGFQSEPLQRQYIFYELYSDRSIDWLELQSHSGAQVTNNINHATLEWEAIDQPADADFYVKYQLNADELGVFSFSTFIDDTLLHCDEAGEGYMALIIEPDPSENTEVIEKVFTLVIDESGSMSGDKIAQARAAAEFIVTHLNDGDDFNIVSFDSDAVSFSNGHVPYNLSNEGAALSFINGIQAGGGTNFNDAFSEAIPQFANADPDKANIIIFFTDGNANQSNQVVLEHLNSLKNMYQIEDLSIFTFGIGSSVNHQLLTIIAAQNNGLYKSLGDDELLEVLAHFYLTIQNPVLLNTTMTFDPPLVGHIYPQPLPNLFKGSQLVVVGRYPESGAVTVYLDGSAFGEPVQYVYDINLSDTLSSQLQFLPRLWAKRKMENMYQQFFIAGSGTPEAQIIEDSIVNTSLCFGVISPFTSFGDNSGGNNNSGGVNDSTIVEVDEFVDHAKSINIYPNPFLNTVSIEIELDEVENGTVYFLQIFNSQGQLIQVIPVQGQAGNSIRVNWDGSSLNGTIVAPGVYFLSLKIDNQVYRTRVIKM